MHTPKSVKNWYLAHSFNTDNYTSIGSNDGKTYVLACDISLDLYFELKKYAGGSQGFGEKCNLKVEVYSDTTLYYLIFYSYSPKIYEQYKIGYNTFKIVNYPIDYEPYLNSKEYVPLTSLTVDNLDLVNINYSQGYQQTNNNFNNIGSFGTKIEKYPGSFITLGGHPNMQTYNGRFIYNFDSRYTEYNDGSWLTALNINPSKYIYNSRTPSTWDFGYYIMQELEINGGEAKKNKSSKIDLKIKKKVKKN